MSVKNKIQYYVIRLTVTALTIVLLVSCSTAPKVDETPQDEQTAAVAETVMPEEQPEPETLVEQEPLSELQALPAESPTEDSDFATFENNGVKLQYPHEWSVFDRTERRAYDEYAIALYEIKKSEEEVYPYICVFVYVSNDIPDGGFEKRKEEANMYFERFTPENGAVIFNDVIINGTDFYKMNVPMGNNLQETILAAVKNDKRYDIYADFDTTNLNEVFLIEEIFNSIEIAGASAD